MAITEMHVASNALKMNTFINVIVPDTGSVPKEGLKNMKVLWLLHGLSDDASAWTRFSRIEEYARRNNLVVVMPSAGRSMYCDGCLGQNYFTHIVQELPVYLSRIFDLSTRKEDNFIAGLSMGGMGAMKIALTYPEKYFAAASFSGLLDFSVGLFFDLKSVKEEFPFMLDAFKDPVGTPLNPSALLDRKKDEDLKLYVSCGLQDSLCEMSRSFIKKANDKGIIVQSDFPDGTHEWPFWDKQVEKFVNYALKC